MNKFGEFLYQLRKEKGLTQAELADKLDITNKAVSKWETGESYPETAQLLPLSKIFNITIDELLKGERNTESACAEQEETKFVALRPHTVKESVLIALGVSLILIGVIMLIVLDNVLAGRFATAIAVSVLVASVSVAVVMFIIMGLKRRMESVEISPEERKRGMLFASLLAAGVALLILSPALLIILSALTRDIIGVAALLGMVAIAMLFIIPSGIGWGNFIKVNNIPSDEDEQKMTPKGKTISEALCGAIMLLATATFLILGLVFNMWHPSWVVFPIGGILCGMVSTIIGGIHNNTNTKK